MPSIVTPPTKKRCLEDEDDSTIEPGSQSKRSKVMVGSTNSTTSDSSSCESGYESDSGSDDGNDTAMPQPLTHRHRAPIQQQFDDETSSSGESESSISSSSSSSSSSSGSESESESNDIANKSGASDVVSVPHRPTHLKPSIGRFNGSTLRNRLTSFLPELRAANEDLEKEIAAGNVAGVELDHSEDAEVDGEYIEMNLGLGVLEEQGDDTGSDTSPDNESAISYDEDNSTRSARKPQPKPRQNINVMNKLMGNQPEIQRPTIEEMAP
ncbi:hypothetical protein GX50_04099 [[Emmonsia] crescens]|uniref:Uncharacterized protein n=1 Tax=[Emmonsia] crescens TaxID=73230 RepID=A0A2B7ZHL2_9EURO|nr:hypothetical protein GX50_04099 [Emmonsia crescens]